MTAGWYRSIFAPRTVALVGASDDAARASGRVQYYLNKWGYSGRVYPVNPSREFVQGARAFNRVSDIPDKVDVAMLMVPAALVPDAVEDCVSAAVGALIVGSSGFSEVGPDGTALELRVQDILRDHRVRLVGPNGNGVISVGPGFTASFMSGLDSDRFALKDDGICLVSQSGAIGAYLFNMGQGSGLGVARFVSTGNEIDLGFSEIVAAMSEDPTTTAILGYVEGLRDGPAFIDAARRASERGVPIVVLKVGSSEAGAIAATSHTASLAGSDSVYEGVFDQLGVVRARSITNLLDCGRLLARGLGKGARLTIATISGGAGILVTDRASETGLELAEWDQSWQDRLRPFLPEYASRSNPIDATGQLLTDDTTLEKICAVVEDHPQTDVLMLIMGNGERFEQSMAERIVATQTGMSTPIIVVWPGGSGEAIQILNSSGVPAFDDPVRCIDALAPIVTRATPSVSVRRAYPDRHTVSKAPVVALDEAHSRQILARYGLPVVQDAIVPLSFSRDHVVAAIAAVGLPAVAKLCSASLHHKSDVGAVRLDLRSEHAVVASAEELRELAASLGLDDATIVLAPYVDAAVEIIVGGSLDPTFGPVVTVGIGGVLTELLSDSITLLPDFTSEELDRAIHRLKLGRLLMGFRGGPTVALSDLDAAVAAVASAIADPQLAAVSIDVNPLVVRADGSVIAVDALIEIMSQPDLALGSDS